MLTWRPELCTAADALDEFRKPVEHKKKVAKDRGGRERQEERTALKRKREEDEEEWLSEIKAKQRREDVEADRKALEDQAKERQEAQEVKPKMRQITTTDQAALDAFAYFDRQGNFYQTSKVLPRSKLENILLCLDEDMTL
eukprot:gene32698-56743_t